MTNGALVKKNAMRLRNRIIPQAGTDVNNVGESRPVSAAIMPADTGCPAFSGVGTESHQPAQVTAAAGQDDTQSVSSTYSLFQSPCSSPHSFEHPSTSRSSSSLVTPSDVVQEVITDFNAPVAVDSRQKKRMRWNEEMNTFIMRTYYLVTNLEKDTSHYLPLLHAHFQEKYPDLQISRQRLGDQRRAIMQRKFLSEEKLERIKYEVKFHLENSTDNAIKPLSLALKTKQRKKWTSEENETIIRKYYSITNLETNKTAYRKLLHEAVTMEQPHLSEFSEQRISDQLRVIIKNKMISEERLQQIRGEIAKNVQTFSSQQTPTVEITPNQQLNCETITDIHTYPQQTNDPRINNWQFTEEPNLNNPEHIKSPTSEIVTRTEEIFLQNYKKFKNSDPVNRPNIPKQRPSRKLSNIVHFINCKILPKHIQTDTDFDTTQTILYCAAYTASTENGCKINDNPSDGPYKKNTPRWQLRLQKRIEDLRVKIGRLTEYIRGNRNKRLESHVNLIKSHYKIHSQHESENTDLNHFLDTLKQKLSVLSNRLRRYKTTTLRIKQNKQFSNNEKTFYRTLNQSDQSLQNTNLEPPDPQTFYEFWSSVWSNPAQHNESAPWLNEKEKIRTNTSTTNMVFDKVTIDLLETVIAKTQNWKATGSDNLHNYWYKKFTTIHPVLLKHINNFIQSPNTVPQYITQGITYMLPKDHSDAKNPAKYRPITCLQNIYKIITACLTELIYKHVDSNNILAEQQKGCRKKSQGCKEQLTVDAIVSRQALIEKRNIYTMYVDYRKAFDSVPHSWLVSVLEHYKINPILINFLKYMMTHWTTILKINSKNSSTETSPIEIRRGIFQGDSLSPLWFCLALNPLSDLLNRCSKGFKIKYNNTHYTLSHLMYMDDIKLYGSSYIEIQKIAKIVEKFSQDIQMKFGIDKCKIQSICGGIIEQNTYTMENGDIIEPVDNIDGYKYLGYQQSSQIHHKEIKGTLVNKFQSRLHKILNSHLNSRNTVKAINGFAIPILTYSFGIINWSKTHLQKLQRIISTLMTKYRKHHPRSCIQRLTLPRSTGGRGIIDIKNLHNKQITTLRSYFQLRAQQSPLHSAILQADHKFTPLNLHDNTKQINENITEAQEKLNIWFQKSLHGRHLQDLNNPNVDKVASSAWLKRGDLFPETEGFMLAIQDQIIETRNYKKYIIRDRSLTTDACRRCHSTSETIQHITGACKSIAQTDYKHRHDQVAAIVHQELALKCELITEKIAYYKYKPQSVIDTTNYKLYWDRTIITDKTVHHNRPDITLHDKKNEIVYLIDITIPNTHNITSTYVNKIAKYTDLSIELKTQWKVRTVKTVPIVISSTGIIPHTLHTSLKQLNINPLIYITIQKAVILNTCRLTRKFLSIE